MYISVVIPLYNKAQSIKNTLNSVLSQSFQGFEIVVVDDGSTDNSAEVVNSVDDKRIRLISKENGGVCSARNRGIKEAKYDYIALLDADDGWDKDYLAEQVRLIEDFPEAAMWGINFAPVYKGKIYQVFETGLKSGFRGYVDDYFNIPNRVSDLFCSSSVVINRNILDNVGYFDERIKYAEDIDVWWRIASCNKIVFYDRIMVFYIHDAENRALNKEVKLRDYLPYYADKFKLFKKYSTYYKYVNNWCAVKLKYYFTQKKYKGDVYAAVKKLDYEVLPLKYKLYFKSPRYLGLVLFNVIEFIHNLKLRI